MPIVALAKARALFQPLTFKKEQSTGANIVNVVAIAPRPSSKIKMANVARVRGVSPRPEVRITTTYKVLTPFYISTYKGSVKVRPENLTFSIALLLKARLTAMAPTPTMDALLAYPVKGDIRALAPLPTVKTDIFVPFGLRARVSVPVPYMDAFVFIPPYFINYPGVAPAPTLRSLLYVPIVASGRAMSRRPRMLASLAAVTSINVVAMAPSPVMRASLDYSIPETRRTRRVSTAVR